MPIVLGVPWLTDVGGPGTGGLQIGACEIRGLLFVLLWEALGGWGGWERWDEMLRMDGVGLRPVCWGVCGAGRGVQCGMRDAGRGGSLGLCWGVQNGEGVRVLLLLHLPGEPNKNGTGALSYPFYARCPV